MINIDVIIPCHNTAETVARAVDSVLGQDNLGKIYLIDDGSTDSTWQILENLYAQNPDKIHLEKLAQNKGVATARNFGAMLAKSDYIAFLDADDEYQPQTLHACAMVFENFEVGLIRLPMTPIDLPQKFANHTDFATAWRTFEMSGAGNTVFYRPYFLALGGFDDDEIFKKFGGEDGALGLATLDTATVATLFDNADFKVGVNYYCHENMHATHLFDMILFNQNTRHINPEDIKKANQSTQKAIDRINKLQKILMNKKGKMPIVLS